MTEALYELIDATGGGCCRLRDGGMIVSASPGFIALTGSTADPSGRSLTALIPGLPDIDQLPSAVDGDSPVHRVIGSDGVGRELSIALVREAEGGGVVLLVNRSGEAKLRRSQARLGRQIDDLKAELAARERQPQRSWVRSLAELARRLDEALARARRYDHPVTIIAISLVLTDMAEAVDSSVGEKLLGCVRGVDDLGRVDAEHWLIVLPHTPLSGGEVVAARVMDRLAELDLTKVGLGVAQVGAEEAGSAAIERADQASGQALESGQKILLAVSLT